MDDKRRFSTTERAALYLAANGQCGNCGAALEPGWHADHIQPYSKSGPTDVINGQALCPACNLKKGSTSVTVLRPWQEDAKAKFYALGEPQDFTVCATPAAGKTTLALSHAADLRRNGVINQVVVVVPTDSLRTQWADAAAREGFQLVPAKDAADYGHAGYDGFVVTYAQIKDGSQGSLLTRRATGIRRTLIVLDEIHHAGDQESWGRGLLYACQHAHLRLMLTGTPWRSSGRSQIPFVTYTDDRVDVDFSYEYGTAVADDVCRRVVFQAYDCDTVRWVDCGRVSEATLNDQIKKADIPAVLETVYNPRGDWINSLLLEADTHLCQVRENGAPDAGAVVFAETQHLARSYAQMLQVITGEKPALVISQDGAEAKAALDEFRAAKTRWIVAVAMISEGVDIPRLAVGVYASKTQTPLFFRQVVGRLVRTRPGEELNAVMFIPAVPELIRHAREIEQELRHQLDLDTEAADKEARDNENAQREFTFREALSASAASFNTAIVSGVPLTETELDTAAQHCHTHGIPIIYKANIARMMRGQAGAEVKVTITPQPQPQPRHRLAKQLRGEIVSLVGKVEYHEGREHGSLNGELLRNGFKPRAQMDIAELRHLLDYLAKRYAAEPWEYGNGE